MVRPRACLRFYWNPMPTSKDKFSGAVLRPAFTNDSKTSTYTSAILCVSTLASAPSFIPANSTARYSGENFCKTFNLIINTLGWSKRMLIVNRKSHVIRHMLILQNFSALKKLRFWQNHEEVLNWLNSTSWAKLYKGHIQKSRREVMCKGYMQRSRGLPGVICTYK